MLVTGTRRLLRSLRCLVLLYPRLHSVGSIEVFAARILGDLLAGRILRSLTEGCGVRVGHLTKVSQEIVRVSNMASWAALEDKTLVIDLVTDPESRQVMELFFARQEMSRPFMAPGGLPPGRLAARGSERWSPR